MKVKFSKRFGKQYDKAPKRIQEKFDERLELFFRDKFHPSLNNHPLSGKYKEHRSINVTGNWRAIFREFEDGELIYFEVIGTHSQLYK